MAGYTQHLQAERRLKILELLRDGGGCANEDTIQTALSSMGYPRLSRTKIRDDLKYLVDRGALKDEWLDDLMVVKLLRRGVDIANGAEEVVGVALPFAGL